MKPFAISLAIAVLSMVLGGCIVLPYGNGYGHDDGYRHDRERGGDDRHY